MLSLNERMVCICTPQDSLCMMNRGRYPGSCSYPQEKVVVESMLVGGGFGGKEDRSVQHHAALCAWLLKRPVKGTFFKGGRA